MKKEELGILQSELVFDRLSEDYRRSFNIGTLDRREVFVKMEYDLVDMQSGFHWAKKKALSTMVISKNNTISERFE